MSAYWITRCHILDPEIYSKYLELAGPAIIKYGGKFLVRGGNQTEKEGGGEVKENGFSHERGCFTGCRPLNATLLCVVAENSPPDLPRGPGPASATRVLRA